ncbi:GIY-YIG nuclease family protein [Patescibacteria group bacterium]|nr:GIY-YIG nuclease family protein [Patescibacteria group bacterium]MBU1721654.1 GIY-YIG nuclease family protein [Patescibacteria group bacterium]MBU1901635.1 GIY-YIG nuclease family protein [Patescibacteria group bacterium]
MPQIIYLLINEAMPGYIKIGRTTNLEQRIRTLDNTSVPLPFECFYACTVSDSQFVEKQLHDAFLDLRVRSNREFFELSPERVVSALKLAEIENVTPKQDYVESVEDQQALNQARTRRSVFNFKMANIPVGAELVFVNDENITAKVVDKRLIEFDGEITSPSASAQKLLGYQYQVQGTVYWMYEGETLDERRRRIELEE